MLRRIWLAIIFALGAALERCRAGICVWTPYRTSPDGNIAITFELKSNPQPYLSGERAYYRVSYKGREVLGDSPLGLDFRGAKALGPGFCHRRLRPANHRSPPGKIRWVQNAMCLTITTSSRFRCANVMLPRAGWI